MPVTPVGTAFKLAYELSPIYLTGNSSTVGNMLGGVLPFIFLTEGINFPLSLITGGQDIELDDFFAHFIPMPGSTLIDTQIATYPFANQDVAANAVIRQPLTVSMRMVCPVRNRLGYAAKIATMMLIKSTLDDHNAHGGTYSILTPSYFYTDCIMTRMSDISGGASAQAQHTWQLDFVQPLITLSAAQDAASQGLMGRLINGGQVTTSSWSGPEAVIGQSVPGGNFATGVVPGPAALGATISGAGIPVGGGLG